MNESILLFVTFLVASVLVFITVKINVAQQERKHEKEMDELRKQISLWPHEKLVYVKAECIEICSIRDAGVSPRYFELLELLDDECKKRGLE